MLRRLNIAIAATAALTVAAWSLPAVANGETPSRAAVSDKSPDVATPKKVRRTAIRKRIAALRRVRPAAPAPVQYTWFMPPYERVAIRWPMLMLGIGY